MQITAVCSIFCVEHLRKYTSSNQDDVVAKYRQLVSPILSHKNASDSELKRLAKTYGRPLILLSNKLQSEVKLDCAQLSSRALPKLRHTLLHIALITNQCLVRMRHILKMKAWAIEKMWNGFLCRAVSYKCWALVRVEGDLFLRYLRSLDTTSLSKRDLSEHISLSTSTLYNRARALLEVDFAGNYALSVESLQSAMKLCGKHGSRAWQMSFLDRCFRVLNKIITDHCALHTHPEQRAEALNTEFSLRSQALLCLLSTHKLAAAADKENKPADANAMTKKQSPSSSKAKALSFWDIAHEYVRCVKARHSETALIRFRKVVIELWMHYAPAPDPHSDEVVKLCVEYIASIGESAARLKIEIVHKVAQQAEAYVAKLREVDGRRELRVVLWLAHTVAVSQMVVKHDAHYLPQALAAWRWPRGARSKRCWAAPRSRRGLRGAATRTSGGC